MPTAHTPTGSASGRPTRRTLAWLVGIVGVVHVAVLLGLSGGLDFQLPQRQAASVSPLQTRMIAAPAPTIAVPAPAPKPPRTRIARETAPASPAAISAPPEAAPEVMLAPTAPTPTPSTAETPVVTATAEPEPPAPPAETPPAPATPAIPAGESLPDMALGALPPSSLLSYRLNGQEKGINYYASGELNWQHNDLAYAMTLSVKAFLVGSRHWRSVGAITTAGLAPRRFSDSWRGERASHFDREKNRIVFSSNAPEAPLLAGAQDQISLYVQLAAAMAGSPGRFVPGTRLQIQTITLRDALPWTLTLEQNETLSVNEQALATTKWVCQPRNRFDSKVEFWVAEKHHWLPVRIRITQVSGSFIDLNLRAHEPLPELPATEKTTPS
ncbi:MAG: DUF3108 domain-containing protein [Limnohabitans sp.]